VSGKQNSHPLVPAQAGIQRKKRRLSMLLDLFVLAAIAVAAALYWRLVRPRLRRLPWWDGVIAELRAVPERVCARLRGLCGNSKTIAVAYAAELLGLLDEAKVLDWSALLGAESAGRVMVIMGAVMIVLRLVTRTAVSFKPES
jgi:hypothetical protein